MLNKTQVILMAWVLATEVGSLILAGTAHSQSVNGQTATLLETNGGNFLWKPSVRGLSKYNVVIPRAAIEQALRYEDTAALFYLSDISEHGLEVSKGTALWGDFHLGHEQSSFEIHWPASKSTYAGFRVNDGKDNLNVTATVNAVMASNAHSIHEIGLSLGEEIQLEAKGAVLQFGSTSEQFYIASLSSEGAANYDISYGQRYWHALGTSDFAWAVGAKDGDAFSSVQLEGNIGTAKGFLRLTAQSNASPRLDLGFKYNLRGKQSSNWRVSASSLNGGDNALDGPSMEEHQRAKLARLWSNEVTLEALRYMHQRQ